MSSDSLVFYVKITSISLAVLPYERVYLENLPCAEMYEKSYMHRDVITHVTCTK